MIIHKPGAPAPLGATVHADGVNFAFFSESEATFSLSLFQPGSCDPFCKVTLDPHLHKTGSIWHIYLQNLFPPFEYAYQSSQGQDLLLDPYAKGVSSSIEWGKKTPYLPIKGRVFLSPPFDWQNVAKPTTPFEQWIIYEMHVRAFTQSPSSHVLHTPGTFLALIEKIPYLKSLGINAVELLPIFEFNECEHPPCNVWGYSTVNFFCPMQRYATCTNFEAAILEFKTLVRELHKNGLRVILDVVYNHTAEGGAEGPTFSLKGFDQKAYYSIDKQGGYHNFSGTGNTVNCNHPATKQLIVDSLSYWVQEMHIDGFRFDLASILTRDAQGVVLQDPPILEAIEQCPLLQETILIAEAWDAAGLYQVGSFPGKARWSEWNGAYRDTVRQFIKGTPGEAGSFASALCGSQPLYHKDNTPLKSINFITSHDGYTLHDLVSYQNKHNEANGEQNRDGTNDNLSWNCGAEGDTNSAYILALRKKQQKNFLLALMVSLGVPMILMGDEYGHTRKGNNNPYCQDNELNWFLWDQLPSHQDLVRFFQCTVALRREFASLFCLTHFLSDKEITWHGKRPRRANWGKNNHLVAFSRSNAQKTKQCLVAFNAGPDPILWQIPKSNSMNWFRIIDTSLQSPYDFLENPLERPKLGFAYLLAPYSAFFAEGFVKASTDHVP